ncbi:hypothetical protein QAD02_001604 [Eretmocerus hayati]|uniref:Uncharacterized protein n=1 Tax=Eretmocerus hayati TaxID=131215 RepID=A0ACC2NGK8_9HYME|nr:hypothetical protein QAD02_001604 [Eretmocerus hayati]
MLKLRNIAGSWLNCFLAGLYIASCEHEANSSSSWQREDFTAGTVVLCCATRAMYAKSCACARLLAKQLALLRSHDFAVVGQQGSTICGEKLEIVVEIRLDVRFEKLVQARLVRFQNFYELKRVPLKI